MVVVVVVIRVIVINKNKKTTIRVLEIFLKMVSWAYMVVPFRLRFCCGFFLSLIIIRLLIQVLLLFCKCLVLHVVGVFIHSYRLHLCV